MSIENQIDTEEKKIFPTTPDAEGFYFENLSDEEDGISTKVYENENKIKRVAFRNGKVATMRELNGKDTKDIARFMGKDPEKYQMAGITVATTVDSEKKPFEYFENLKMKDYNKLLSIYMDLNF